jgi:adenylate cyclase
VSGLEQTDEEAEAAFEALATQGVFLTSCGRTNWPDGTVSARYLFVHDLYRETLYGRIPPRRRARLHLRIGANLERGYGVQARDVAAELAVHFVEGNDVPRAVRYLRYAAEQALARSAHREAIELLERALHLVESLPESAERDEYELAVLAALAPALMAIRGWGSVDPQRAYQRAKEISLQLDDQSRHGAVLVGLATVFEARADYRQSQVLLEECLGRLSDGRPESLVVESHALLACSLFHQGAFGESVEHAKQAVTLYRPGGKHPLLAASGADPAIGAEDWAALSLWFLGYPDRALAKAEEVLRRAQNHVFTLALAQDQAAVVHMLRREPLAVRELAGAAIEAASKNGFPYWFAVGTILHGWARAMQGEVSEGIVEIKGGIEGCRTTSVEMDRPFYLGLLAEAYIRNEQPDEAMSVLSDAFAMVRHPRTFFYEAELYRLRGNALRKAGGAPLQDAEACFQQALEAARRYATPALELRAAVSLARLWRDQGKHGQGRELLIDVSAKFTEGMTTGDLVEARAIIREMEARPLGNRSGGPS